ncbi:aminopeptidase [Candidatus Woesearchaeota archaeon]|nr:aminopeptidase [Candidatus Woesearchaeota archaeon]
MAVDERAVKVAKIVVDYSVDIQKGDILLIQTEKEFKEFAEVIEKFAKEKGAEVIYRYRDLAERKALIERNDMKELKKEAKEYLDIANKITAKVSVDATTDPYYLKGVEPKKIVDYNTTVIKPVQDIICGDGKKHKGKKWNCVGYPCEADAKNANMSIEEYSNILYESSLVEWEKEKEQMKKVKAIFDNAEEIHIISPGLTDIRFSLKGRGGQLCCGEYNIPDGELMYGPVEDSANGYITFSYPAIRDGQKVDGIKLMFKEGNVTSFSAEENQEFLAAMMDLDGSKRIGEFALGFNYKIPKVMNNLIFDEKIGGTFHLAMGESYAEPLDNGGGLNEAEIHWDLVCDLRKANGLPGGEIYVDGKLVQKDGKWLID